MFKINKNSLDLDLASQVGIPIVTNNNGTLPNVSARKEFTKESAEI
jgi:hypothetical protein